jgi:hypothetical protein
MQRFKDLLGRVADEHFEGEKERLYFLVNNYDFIYSNLQTLHLEKGV